MRKAAVFFAGRPISADELPAGRGGESTAPCLPAGSVLGVTKGWLLRLEEAGDARLASGGTVSSKRLVAAVFADSHESYGAPRIQAELADDYGLRRLPKASRPPDARARDRGRSRGARASGRPVRAREAPAATDLVRRRFRSSGRDRLWVADITYVPSWQGYVFLACVIDAWSRKVVGWSMRDDLRAELALDALGMALERRRPAPGLVHHSDRGSQYTSLAFGKTLSESRGPAEHGPPRRRLRQRRLRGLLRNPRDGAHRPAHLQDSR